MKGLSYVIVLAALLTSCSTSRKSLPGAAPGGLSGAEYVEKAVERASQHRNLTARTRVVMDTGGGAPVSVSASIKIRKGEIIRISVTPFLGIEVARIDITPNSLLVTDKVNMRYAEAGFSEICGLLGADVDFDMIQSVLMNEIFLPGKRTLSPSDAKRFTLSSVEGRAMLQTVSSDGIGCSFFMSADGSHPEETILSSRGMPFPLRCVYKDFTVSDGNVIPGQISIYTGGESRRYSVDMKLSRISTDADWDAGTALSSRYRKVSIMELLRALR